jgi:hypothetical protein
MNMPDRLRFDVPTAQAFANQGRLEEWVHAYLLGGDWANPGLSDGLKLQQRWWLGPLELPLAALERCVGPEPGMEYPVTVKYWEWRTGEIADGIRASGAGPLDLPPLIAMYDQGHLSVRDGNHRYGAYEMLGWPTAWALVWFNSQEEYLMANSSLGPRRAS